MKYYCIGNKIKLANTSYSHSIFENLSFTDAPALCKIPVTQEAMQAAFKETKELILCKNLEDAKKLRLANTTIGNASTPEALKTAIAFGYPLDDHAIYEIDVTIDIDKYFFNLKTASNSELRDLIAADMYFYTRVMNDRSKIPDIAVYVTKKARLNPQLIACHYFSLENGQEEIIASDEDEVDSNTCKMQ